jgi:hypothetical protein
LHCAKVASFNIRQSRSRSLMLMAFAMRQIGGRIRENVPIQTHTMPDFSTETSVGMNANSA